MAAVTVVDWMLSLLPHVYTAYTVLITSGVNGSVTLGGWIDAKGKVSWGEPPPPSGYLFLEMDVKLIFYGGKIENTYMFRCFFK